MNTQGIDQEKFRKEFNIKMQSTGATMLFEIKQRGFITEGKIDTAKLQATQKAFLDKAKEKVKEP